MSEWNNIKTAPKDGTEILAARNRSYAIVSWRKTLPGDFPREDPHPYWRTERGFTFAPTHWQPIPPAPVPNGLPKEMI